MPVTPTYPGVYIEELPSGVRTIVGVATSITAFIGRALRGPVNSPTRIQSFGDYQRTFGGLWFHSPMSYAVRHFFQNGGTDALIVRLTNSAASAAVNLPVEGDALELAAVTAGADGNNLRATLIPSTLNADDFDLIIEEEDANGLFTTLSEYTTVTLATLGAAIAADPEAVIALTAASASRPPRLTRVPFVDGADAANGDPAVAAVCNLFVDSVVLTADNAGAWGNNLQASVDYDTADPGNSDIFNLTLEELDTAGRVVAREVFRNLTFDDESARYIEKVLDEESNLASFTGPVPAANLIAGTQTFFGGTDGNALVDNDYVGDQNAKTGLYALEDADLFNLLYIPPRTRENDVAADVVLAPALAYCQARRAMLIVDPPSSWTNPAAAENATTGVGDLRADLGGTNFSINAIAYFPRLRMPDPLQENRTETFGGGGALAGLIARTDAQRGVWKAPAGIEASLSGVRELNYKLTDGENGRLNPLGLNCLRTFPVYGHVVWGARTLAGDDRLASEWKYVPVRRTALYIEESLYRGLHWVVFEPNDESLWAQIRLNVTAFMQDLFRKGAFQGQSPREAFLVKCDRETTTQFDIDRGIVNILVGFAPLKPAEFVIIQIQQLAGQTTA